MGEMDPYDSPLRSPYTSPKDPFLHSLLRTSQSLEEGRGDSVSAIQGRARRLATQNGALYEMWLQMPQVRDVTARDAQLYARSLKV